MTKNFLITLKIYHLVFLECFVINIQFLIQFCFYWVNFSDISKFQLIDYKIIDNINTFFLFLIFFIDILFSIYFFIYTIII